MEPSLAGADHFFCAGGDLTGLGSGLLTDFIGEGFRELCTFDRDLDFVIALRFTSSLRSLFVVQIKKGFNGT